MLNSFVITAPSTGEYLFGNAPFVFNHGPSTGEYLFGNAQFVLITFPSTGEYLFVMHHSFLIIYNTNLHVDVVIDIVYTKFGLKLSIRSQDFEQKPNSDDNQGP